MTDEDIFREVDEDLRREQLKVYWEKFGIYILGAAAAIVIAVAGYTGWKAWSKERSNTAGAEYQFAQDLAQDGKNDAAANAFAKLVKEGPAGYQTLSSFQLASTHVAQGKIREAVSIFDKLAKNSGLDPVLKGFAKIQGALLRIDQADHAEMKKRLGAMAVTGNYWRHSARELLGLSAYKANNLKEAESYYDTIIKDAEAPQQLRARANMMMSLIKSAETANGKK